MPQPYAASPEFQTRSVDFKKTAPFWLFPIHFSKPALQSFMPPKARKLPRRGWLDSLFSIEVGGLFPFHSLTPALSPMGFTHAARMSEWVGQWWGYQPVLANIR